MIRVSRLGAALATAVLVAGASACGVLGQGQSSSPTGLTERWSAGNPRGASSSATLTWVTDGLVVTTSPDGDGLIARSLSSGHTEWSWTASAPPSGYQRADVSLVGSPSTGTGVVDIVYWRKGDPTFQGFQDEAGIDLANGHITWKRGSQLVVDSGSARSGGLIATIDANGNPDAPYVEADAVATGKPAWSTESNPALKNCAFQNVASSGALVYGTAICSDSKVLYGLSARTGAVESKVTLDDSSSCDAGLNVWTVPGYLLVGCDTDKPSTDRLLELRPGSSRQLVLYSSKGGMIDQTGQNTNGSAFFLSGSTLYFSTTGGPDARGIDAVGLTSGKRLWQQATDGTLVGADKSGALAVIPGDSTTSSLTTATLSAASGAISYGPGTTVDDSASEHDLPTLIGHTLLIAGDATENTPTVAYTTGSWPS